MSADQPPRQIGPYRFVHRLGEGGMGVVWRGVDTNLDRPVAMKVLNAASLAGTDRHDEVLGRMSREAKAAARINSPHVCRILHLERTASGDTCIVMELVDGRTLKDELNNGARLSPHRAVRIAMQIAQGMAAAHELGVVHRDLKPANIMLVEQDGDPDFVKILDFGLAKIDDGEALTRAGDVIGTVRYMAPEQITSGAVDARTDIYSLGVLLFRMLTGSAPFEGDSPPWVIDGHLKRAPPRMRDVAKDAPLSDDLERIVARCLEKSPARRYASMRDLAAALGDAEVLDDVASRTEVSMPQRGGGSRRVVQRPAPRAELPEDPTLEHAEPPTATMVARSQPRAPNPGRRDGAATTGTTGSTARRPVVQTLVAESPDVATAERRRMIITAMVTTLAVTIFLVALWLALR